MLRLFSPLLESSIMDHTQPRYLSEVNACQSMIILDPGHHEGKEKLHKSSHLIPIMMQANHYLGFVSRQSHPKQPITLMNVWIPPPYWKYTTPNVCY